MDVIKSSDSSHNVSEGGGAAMSGEEGTPRTRNERRRGRFEGSKPASEPMRHFPGAETDEMVGFGLDSIAESVVRLSPAYKDAKKSVAEKLKDAIRGMNSGE